MAPEWNSLEIARIAVSALTPIVIFVLGIVVTRAARRVEDAQWANRTIIEKRLEVYGQLAPLLNDIYCFFMMVGHFASIMPPEVLERKRQSDKLFFVHEPLFESGFTEKYLDFINTCFLHFVGVGKPAQLRADAKMQEAERGDWNPEWNALFVGSDPSPRAEVDITYRALMRAFADQVGVRHPALRGTPGWVPVG